MAELNTIVRTHCELHLATQALAKDRSGASLQGWMPDALFEDSLQVAKRFFKDSLQVVNDDRCPCCRRKDKTRRKAHETCSLPSETL